MRDKEIKKSTTKGYNKGAKKSTAKKKKSSRTESIRRATKSREARRKQAKQSIPIEKLARELDLKQDEKVTCPFCQKPTLELEKSTNESHCTSCQKKATTIKLVKEVLDKTDWQAIAWLEGLASKLASQPDKPATCKKQKKTSKPKSKVICAKKQSKPKKARFCDSDLERIKRKTDLVGLVRATGVKLKRQGKDYAGLCPFHPDKNPSLVVTPGFDKNLFHCFGCGKAGSSIDWVMQIQNLDFRPAVEWLIENGYAPFLAASDKSPAPASQKPEQPQQEQVIANEQLMSQVFSCYHHILKNTPQAIEYLHKRGIVHPEVVDFFQLGFCDGSLGKRISDKMREQLKESGIYNDKNIEHFAGCLTIPIINESGHVVEAYGRRIKESEPKHLYLPGPHRGIFNPRCLTSKQIALCEAKIDALSMWIHDIRYVTSSFGSQGLTAEMVEAFVQHGVSHVIIAYDWDQGGHKGAEKTNYVLEQRHIDCLRVRLPDGMDVNEFIRQERKAGEKLRKLVKDAVPMVQGKLILAPLAAKKEAIQTPKVCSQQENISPLAAKEQEKIAAKEKIVASAPAPHVASPTLRESPLDVQVVVRKDELEILLEPRRYRIRGFGKNLSFDVMRINLAVFQGELFYADTLDLYQARQRTMFIKATAGELQVSQEVIKRELGRIWLKLEQLQQQNINATLEPKVEKPKMSKAEEDEAIKFLESPELVEKIARDFRDCGLVGEEENALLGYFGSLSRKQHDPLMLIVQSSSAAGKTALMDAILVFIPEEEKIKYTAMTGQALFYLGEEDLKHKTLAISEEEGAEKATYPLKLLQSEKHLRIASTGKDPKSGKQETHDYKVEGPAQIFLTTTSPEIDEELQNRCLILMVSENRQQTQAIHNLQRQRETLEGLLLQRRREKIIKRQQNMQRLLKPLLVVNPYAKKLTFIDSKLRNRRDNAKYLTLIRSIALLHQYQREVKQREEGGEVISYIEVEPSDIALANRLVCTVLGVSLDELAPQTRRLLGLIYEMVEKRCQKDGLLQQECHFTRREVREYSGFGQTQLRVHLERLVEFEYILPHRGRNGQQYLYELLYHGKEEDGVRFFPGLINVDQLTPGRNGQNLAGVKDNLAGVKDNLTGTLRTACGPLSGTLRGEILPSSDQSTRDAQPGSEKRENHI